METPNNQQQLVVVLGMHRSGTSAITRGLQVMGVSLGNKLMPPVADNKKGFWEDLDVVAINNEMLNFCGRCWHSIDPIQQIDVELLCDQGYLSRAIGLLQDKIVGHKRFAFKDPRTAKMLPFWIRVFATGNLDVRYILALRNPSSVAKSLAQRDQFSPEKSYLLWIDHMLTS